MARHNVYQMYTANGERAGFFIRRDSWARSTFARVLMIDGRSDGPLPGPPPYHGNAPVRVEFHLNGQLKDPNMLLSCPGTYAYTQIEPSQRG